MVYVIIYPQKGKVDEAGFSRTESKKFRSVEHLIKYCFTTYKANYITLERAADNSFDYYVRLND